MDLYFAVNTSAGAILFGLVVLPSLVLCVLCVLALFRAEGLAWQMKALLINIFAAEICNWLSLTLFIFGPPVREGLELGVYPACAVPSSLYFVSALQKMSSTTLYAIMVYVFIKYGKEKLKWQVIATCIALSWVLSLGYSTIPYFPGFGLVNDNGYCGFDSESVLLRASLPVIQLEGFICVVIIITFSILTYCYTKKNAMEGSTEVKKAVAKNLYYLMISTIISFSFSFMPALFPYIRAAFAESAWIILIVVDNMFTMFLSLPSVATPIAAVVILKPVQMAIREVCSKMCACCRHGAGGDSTTRAE